MTIRRALIDGETVLLKQGDIPTKCYFILKGCIRQFSFDEEGKEVTSNFYIEEQVVSIFNYHKQDKASPYSLSCLEDGIFVVGNLDDIEDVFSKHLQLETMTRKMVEESLGEAQDDWASFISFSPEKRYKALLQKRPELVNRVPQHQLASYLGMTPESLSRIKKRIKMSDL